MWLIPVTILEQVEGPVIVLNRISGTEFVVAEGGHCNVERVKWYVCMGIHSTQPEDGIPDIEVKEEKEGLHAVHSGSRYSGGGCTDGPHGANFVPANWGLG